MSLWKKMELSIFSYLYRRRTVRMAKKYTNFAKSICFAMTAHYFLNQSSWKEDLLIKNYEEMEKPQSFFIDGPDPFKLTEEQWRIIQ